MGASADSVHPAPPSQVVTALALFSIGFFIALIRVVLKNASLHPTTAVVGVIVILGLGSLWVYGLYGRRNRLRWFTVVWVGCGLVATPWAAAKLNDPRQLIMLWIQFSTALPAIVLLIMPVANRWYGRRDLP